MHEANTLKVLAFMEVSPLTDKFQQIVLTDKQARAMRDALFTIISGEPESKAEFSQFDVVTNDAVEMVLPNIRDSYTDEYIKTAQESQG